MLWSPKGLLDQCRQRPFYVGVPPRPPTEMVVSAVKGDVSHEEDAVTSRCHPMWVTLGTAIDSHPREAVVKCS